MHRTKEFAIHTLSIFAYSLRYVSRIVVRYSALALLLCAALLIGQLAQVAAENRATSATIHSTARAAPRVLLVDDDGDNPDVRSRVAQPLNALGVNYDVWDTLVNAEPNAATLANYAMVIWIGGHYGSPALATEPTLAAFLQGGGCLFLSSQELYYNNNITLFMQQYLGVAAVIGDVGHAAVRGTGVVFGGLGPLTLDPTQISPQYSPSDSDVVTPTLASELAFYSDKGNSGVFHDGGRYRSVYLGFSFEAISTVTGRQSVLQRAASWCDALPLVFTTAAPPSAILGQPYSHHFTATGVPKPSFSLAGGTLPPGITLSADGVLSGVPTRRGTFSGIVVSASNGVNPNATQNFTLIVARDGRVFVPMARR